MEAEVACPTAACFSHRPGLCKREFVSALEESLVGVSVRTVRQSVDDVAGRTLFGGKDHRQVAPDELVDAEACHRAERSIDNVNAKGGEVDDEVAEALRSNIV